MHCFHTIGVLLPLHVYSKFSAIVEHKHRPLGCVYFIHRAISPSSLIVRRHRLFGTHAHAAPEFYVEHAPLPAVAPAARDQPADADAPGAAAAAGGPAGGGDEADRIVPAPEVEQRG